MQVQKVVVGSESSIKLRAVKAALKAVGFDIEPIGCKAESGIPAQPIGKSLMTTGAISRAKNARRLHPDANLYIGIENGLVLEGGSSWYESGYIFQNSDRWYDPACVAVLVSGSDVPSIAFSAHFPIPRWIVERVTDKKSEMGFVIQELAGGGEKDPMKWLSHDTIPREELLAQAVHCALLEIVFPERYREPVLA